MTCSSNGWTGSGEVWAGEGKVAGNPLIRSDRPWEGYLILQPGSVIYSPEKQIFEMWYNTLPRTGEADIEQFVCYATSKDGIRWEKPELNHMEFRGSKANNIVLRWNNWNHSVIRDPEDPDPDRRYKMGYWQTRDRERCGIWAAFSPDGIRWTDYEKNPVVPCWATGDTFAVMRDPVSRQYWLYHKTNPGGPRKVSRLVSDDFIHWTDDRLVLEPDIHDRPRDRVLRTLGLPLRQPDPGIALGLSYQHSDHGRPTGLQPGRRRVGP